MAEHNPQYLIELDGNKSPEDLFTVSAGGSPDILLLSDSEMFSAVLVL